jgi:hypothetical protein
VRVLHLAVILSLIAPAAAPAQDATAQMIEMAQKIRAQAAQMKDQLPPEDIADMLSQADQLEKDARAGGFNAPPPPPPGVAQRIADAHGGRLEWLRTEAACAGYDRENYTTYRLTTGDRDAERDVLCRKAFDYWQRYFKATVSGGGTAAGDPLLIEYDKAARAAVDFYERR